MYHFKTDNSIHQFSRLLLLAAFILASLTGYYGCSSPSPATESGDSEKEQTTQTSGSEQEKMAEETELPVNLTYPDTREVDTVDNYHGTEVADPYRWLEDLDSEATADWVKRQNDVTMPYLEKLPMRDSINSRLTELWDYPKYSVPFKEGDRFFYRHNDGLQNQSVLYVTDDPAEKGEVLLDPNTLSEDGTAALASLSVSDNGEYLAYGISQSGSDWRTFHVRDITSGKDMSDTLNWIKFSGVSWHPDNSGFYYSRFPEPKEGEKYESQNKNMKVYFHELGTPQSKDRLVYERPDKPDWGIYPFVTEDGEYLFFYLTQGTDPRNRLYYKELGNPDAEVVKLLNDFDASYNFITNEGSLCYFETNKEAPKNKVITIDLENPEPENWKTVIPEQEEVMESISVVDHKLVVSYMQDARSVVKLYDMEGNNLQEIPLPALGSVSGFSGEKEDSVAYYSFTSFTYPSTVFKYDFREDESTIFRQPDVDFNPDEFVVKQEFYYSKDSTRVPMFIVHKKGLKRDGSNPVYLYGYGGFNISLTPRFSLSTLVWMEMGGIYALPNIRGGGEYGEAWHKAGIKENKQNVFDDFVSAAEYLINRNYTSKEHIAISGGSNGGLLVGACMTQEPDLFAAALPAVGVLDMLRYHKFTIGWAWASDYGTSDDSTAFEYLYDYSPLHNLEAGTAYPATLITTADHDDRVVPSHSFKFASMLQEKHGGEAPVLIRIEAKAGHGAGMPTSKRIQISTDRLAFAAYHTGLAD